MSIKSILLGGAMAAVSLAGALPAHADSGVSKSQFDAMQRSMQAQIDYLKRQVEILGGQQKATETKTAATAEKVDTAVAAVAKVTPPKGKKGIQVGAVTITPGGFLAAEGLYRDKNMTSDIDTKFNAVPFGNSSNAHVDETRFSARQSRLSLLATSDVDSSTHLGGYYEMDFLGAAGTANSNQSNSYNLRIRNIYSTVDWDDLGLHLLAGQNWSLATLNSKGITPRNEVTPLSIDAQYVVGFDWTRSTRRCGSLSLSKIRRPRSPERRLPVPVRWSAIPPATCSIRRRPIRSMPGRTSSSRRRGSRASATTRSTASEASSVTG
jgi:hypothetical protein